MRRLGCLALFLALAQPWAQAENAPDREQGEAAPQAAGSQPQPAEEEAEQWIESYDKASNRKFYYSARTRKSAWEAPPGAKIRYDDGSVSYQPKAKPQSSMGLVFASFLFPILLPLAGLAYCYYMASKEGLHDVLKSLKAKRERSSKRRSSKAGGRAYSHGKKKLSQDGKGGRSANS